MNDLKKINIAFGWLVFAIALTVYCLTVEPTASFWDCGEFIAASYKLQVPHPPGAPLFLLIGRLFSFLSFGDVSDVAYWVNFVSVLAGAFTAMFLFWSIVLMGNKLVVNTATSTSRNWMLMGAGLVGALSYTFTDSAWFSSVEAEVYCLSSFFTAFVFWAMLKWQTIEDESRANRWLIFIFYMMGLSIGVHLLSLVTIPALALIFYFRKFKTTKRGIVVTLIISLVIIFLINDLIIPGLPTAAGKFEIFFVNMLGLPFGSGAVVFALIVISALVISIRFTQDRGKVILNTSLLAFTFILIGYSSYAIVVIRSGYDTPINENDPSDVMRVVRYLKREQYGSRPLFYGPYFTARAEGLEEGEPIYVKGQKNYEIADRRLSVRYAARDQTIFPRIWSTEENHKAVYRDRLGLRAGERPTFSDNLRFLFEHQIGWMYVRYFLFNFAGRESDAKDAGWLGPKQWFEELPPTLAENRARNNFFMIPFLLGLIGMYCQAVRNTRNFFVVAFLFVLTGAGLVVYLNSPPVEPRERDYIYSGSYYTFCFWIGFSVITLTQALVKLTRNFGTAAIASLSICMTAPLLMLAIGWNDHNRAKRYFSVDTAINDLHSCAPDSILFTGGDNDTFPQWYVQDVEGIRTDVRVIVTSYFNTEWYIHQTMRKAYESKAFPYTLTKENYREGGPNNPYLPYYDAGIKSMDLKQYLELLKKDHKGLRLYPTANVVPARDIVLKVDVANVKRLNIVPETLQELIVPEMHFQLREDGLEMKDLALLDILATAEWERPVYVSTTALRQFNIDLTPYVVREGNTYRILPVLNPNPEHELFNTEKAYDNMVRKFQFRGLDDPTIYYTEDYRGAIQNHRFNFNLLAEALLVEGDTVKAREVLLHSLEKMPDEGVRYDGTAVYMFQLLFAVGEKKRAIQIADVMSQRADQLIGYYLEKGKYGNDLRLQLAILGELARGYYANGEIQRGKVAEEIYARHASVFEVNKRNM